MAVSFADPVSTPTVTAREPEIDYPSLVNFDSVYF